MKNVRRFRRAAPEVAPGSAAPVALLMPGAAAGEWELCRTTGGGGAGSLSPEGLAVTRQVFGTLDAAAANLGTTEAFVLSLPVETGIVQRLTLPAAEPAELEEMARIQLEKILPYPVETVNVALQEVARTDAEVVVAVETVHQDRMLAVCQPLVAREHWPARVIFQALALAESTPGEGQAAFIYREAGRFVLGIGEGGRLSFAQALSGQTAEDLAAELPAVLLGAELEGVPTNFETLRLDAVVEDWSDTLQAVLNRRVVPFDPGAAAQAAVSRGGDGDLSPASWRAERLRGARMARLRRRLLTGAAVYVGLIVLGFLWLGVLKFQVSRLDSRLDAARPLAAESKDADTHWRKLASAVQPSRYLVDVVQQIYECLPPNDSVRLTSIELTRILDVQGEAPSPAAAVDFTDKLKASSALKPYHLEADPPKSLPSGRAAFRIKGNLP